MAGIWPFGGPCDITVEVNGTKGTLAFESPRLNELMYGDAGRIRAVRDAAHPGRAPQSSVRGPLVADRPGHRIWSEFVNQVAELLRAWPNGAWTPELRPTAGVQAICEAMERSADQQGWVRVGGLTDARGGP